MRIGLRSNLQYTTAISRVGGPYAIGGFRPALVFDFDDEYYRTSRAKTTFESAISHNSTTAQNGTMVDSDGLLKWRPHNLSPDSEDLSAGWSDSFILGAVRDGGDLRLTSDEGYAYIRNGTPTLSTGIKFTVSMFLTSDTTVNNVPVRVTNISSGNYALVNLVAGVETQVSIELIGANQSAIDIGLDARSSVVPGGSNETGYTVTFNKVHLYRSDLGGMVNNPDRGDSYVPTTDSPRYLPRRGHHVYNGSAWVNEGLLHESESRTNLVTDSEDFTAASWGVLNTNSVTRITDQVVAPDGTTTMDRIQITDTTNESHGIYDIISNLSSGSNYCFSSYVKAGEQRYVSLVIQGALEDFCAVVFDILSGTATATDVGTNSGTITGYGVINCGNGIYRIWLAGVVDPSSSQLYPVIGFVSSGTPTLDNLGRESYAGTAGDGFYAWGAQFEQGALISAGPPAVYADAPTPSSYIPTSGAAVTRAAETLTIPAAKLPWPSPEYVTGTELVTNGTDFTGASGATPPTGWYSVGASEYDNSSGALQVSNTSAANQGTSVPLTGVQTGDVIKIAFDLISSTGSGLAYVRIGNSGTEASTSGTDVRSPFSDSTPASYSYFFVAATDNPVLKFFTGSSGLASFTIDNISVKEINPLSVSIQMDGRVTFADTDVASDVDGGVGEAVFHLWKSGTSAYIETVLDTDNGTGMASFVQEGGGARDVVSSTGSYYTPGVLVPYNISSRHGSTFINGATDGVEIGEDVTPVALPDLSATDLNLAHIYMGTIRTFRMWNKDLTDAGIEEAST